MATPWFATRERRGQMDSPRLQNAAKAEVERLRAALEAARLYEDADLEIHNAQIDAALRSTSGCLP